MLANSEDRSVTIEAQVQREFEPDMFRLMITFEGERPERAECVESYNGDFARVKAVLAEAGIVPDEIKSSSFSVSVRYDWLYEKVDSPYELYRRKERVIDGYEYWGACSVERRVDFALLADIWNALYQVDGDFSFDIDYTLERPDEHEKELLRSAVAEARDRAEVLAGAAGSVLADVKSIHYRFNHASSNYVGGALCPPSEDAVSRFGAVESIPEFNPEPITVRCNVTVVWSLAA